LANWYQTKFAAHSKFDSTHTRTVSVHERGGEEEEEEEEDLFVFNLNDTVRGYRGNLNFERDLLHKARIASGCHDEGS
jgi:hypothetical protein